MRKIIPFLLLGILVLNSLGVGAFSIENTNKNINKQIYLGYAKITGNGNTSILEAVAENDIIVGIENKTSYVDFYINYEMNCNGDTDNGQIWLTVAINGQNITPALATTFNTQNGTLKIEGINVNRKDSFSFVIEVVYVSVIPFYINETRALGAGVVSKSAQYISDWIIYIGLIKDKIYHRHDRVEFTGLKVFYIHHLWDEPLSYGFLHDVYVGYDVNYKIGILTRHFVCAMFFVQ